MSKTESNKVPAQGHAIDAHCLADTPSRASEALSLLRSSWQRNDRSEVRRLVRELGTYLGYEISKILSFKDEQTQTPLGIAKTKTLLSHPVLATVLRAGLPFHAGFLSVFPNADCAFVSAYRRHSEQNFEIQLDAVTCPNLENRILIVADTMLATGRSMSTALRSLFEYGTPARVIVASVIASHEGLKQVKANYPHAELWTVAIDDDLNPQKYIVPGIGDAGDMMFGEKLQR